MKKIICIILIMCFISGGLFADDAKCEIPKYDKADKTALVIWTGVTFALLGTLIVETKMGEYKN